MRRFRIWAIVALSVTISATTWASAYNARPKLIVVIVIDQFRSAYLDGAHDQFEPSGFRLFTDRGAWFTNCNYDYANTETGPGHATLLTGSYTDGHGILSNEWWDTTHKRMASVGSDDAEKLLDGGGTGFSPRVLTTDTLGDELKLATDNRARVFTLSLKPRAAVLPGGFAADAAYWTDPANGHWQTSTYYTTILAPWVAQLNRSGRAESYWDREWKDFSGAVMARTSRPAKPGASDFFDIVGATPLANDWELEFARQLIEHEKLGEGAATDLLVIGLSANDLLGHAVGPNAPQLKAMVTATDHQLAEFFNYLGQRLGLANVWLALSADHGVAPTPAYASKLRLPGAVLHSDQLAQKVKVALNARFSPGKDTNYFHDHSLSHWFLNETAFAAVHLTEAQAERAVCDTLLQNGLASCYTRTQLAAGDVARDAQGRQYLHSYSPYGGWWVLAAPPPFTMSVSTATATTHGTPYEYDTHVPLAFYGFPFQPGVYPGKCEPIDMAPTLASLLGINAPARSEGRVLTEAIRTASRER